jgi:DNA-binding MarR family transcriptional regulator
LAAALPSSTPASTKTATFEVSRPHRRRPRRPIDLDEAFLGMFPQRPHAPTTVPADTGADGIPPDSRKHWRRIRSLIYDLREAVDQAASHSLQPPPPIAQAQSMRVDSARSMNDRLVACLARHHRDLPAAQGQAPLNHTQYAVASLLLARSNHGWPTMSFVELGKLAGTSPSNAKAAVQELEGRGLLKRAFEPGRENTFDLTRLVDHLEEILNTEDRA